MGRAAALLCAAALWPGLAAAQADPRTLADIRAEIAALGVQIEGLRAELVATGQATAASVPGSPIERLDAIEAALQRLTSRTEELEFRINRITVDGTNRLGDLEFRVCELEEDCDPAALGETPGLGGIDQAAAVPLPDPAPPAEGPPLAVGELAAFEAAETALAGGDAVAAADLFAQFVLAYPVGPLTPRAHLGRAEALAQLGDTSNSARAYLDAFTADPAGPFAADALLGLGRGLAALGQVPDACITLGEIAVRFPASPLVFEAQAERQRLACP
jgi:TolA-binding protein